jgi:hypothetical protein
LAELADDAQHGSGFERAVTVLPALAAGLEQRTGPSAAVGQVSADNSCVTPQCLPKVAQHRVLPKGRIRQYDAALCGARARLALPLRYGFGGSVRAVDGGTCPFSRM